MYVVYACCDLPTRRMFECYGQISIVRITSVNNLYQRKKIVSADELGNYNSREYSIRFRNILRINFFRRVYIFDELLTMKRK